MRRRRVGNLALLGVTAGAVLGLIGLVLGGRVYRWEAALWYSVTAVTSLLGYWYSRRPEP